MAASDTSAPVVAVGDEPPCAYCVGTGLGDTVGTEECPECEGLGADIEHLDAVGRVAYWQNQWLNRNVDCLEVIDVAEDMAKAIESVTQDRAQLDVNPREALSRFREAI